MKSYLSVFGIALLCGVIVTGCSTIGSYPLVRLVEPESVNDNTSQPTAGASYYIHFGPTGLCVTRADWSSVEQGKIGLQYNDRLVAIKGGADNAETLVEITTQTNDTSDPYDDDLIITVRVASEGLGDDTDTKILPLYDIGGGIGSFTTANEPPELFVRKIEYLGGSDTPTAIINNSRVPMLAKGFFTTVSSGESGFLGGGGPDCVQGSLNNDVIRTRGGADYVSGSWGNDFIDGGEDSDTLVGGPDEDILFGAGGSDLLRGDEGSDCHDGGQDGLRDVLDDRVVSFDDVNLYVIEEGTVNGVSVDTIEFITDTDSFLNFSLVERCE